MNIKEMVYQFKLEANKVDSAFVQKIPLPAVISYLNRGQMQLLKRRYGGNNNYRSTLEGIQKRIDEWQRLIVPNKNISGIADKENKLFNFPIGVAEDYMILLRSSFLLSKGECTKQLSAVVNLTQDDDLNINLDNPNTTSNFEWREINYRLASDNILAYTDPSFSFTIDTAIIDYLRYPKSLDVEGYTLFDGSNSSNVDCELPVFLREEVVNESVLLFKASLNHPDLQSSDMVQKIQE